MKFGQLVACLKSAMDMHENTLEKMIARIIYAIGYAERRIKLMSDAIFDPDQQLLVPGAANELDFITDNVYRFIVDKEMDSSPFEKSPLFLRLAQDNELVKGIDPSNAKERVQVVLDQLKDAMGHFQYGLYGTKNAWIVKPGGKSRGRGIEVHCHKDNLVRYIKFSVDKVWVTQKYIESPLIIRDKKFDIRQWVCVTSWKPKLEIWFYTESYLRFTSETYDPENLHNKFANLTNACINEHNIKEDTFEDKELMAKVEVDGKEELHDDLKIEGNMWTYTQFATYLDRLAEKQGVTADYPNGIYKDKILPQLKKGVISSLLAARDSMIDEKSFLQHETFGYDFMVDTSFNVWLIECNSSPSMEYSSAITERMVKEGLHNLADIAVEQEKYIGRPESETGTFASALGQKMGTFELIYNE